MAMTTRFSLHGMPELGQERVDVVGERFQLKTFAALKEATLFVVAKRHASSVQKAKCSITSSKRRSPPAPSPDTCALRRRSSAYSSPMHCLKKAEIVVEKEGPAASPQAIDAR
jgi:hypothetical protein